MEKHNQESREMHISRVLNAPIELVWEVWAQPEHIVNWWGPKGFTSTIHTMDFEENGGWKLTLHGPDGTDYVNRSIFKEIILHEKIVFEHFNPHFTTTVRFKSIGKTTELNWTMLFDTAEMREIVVKTHKADEGQKQNVEKLEKYLAQKISDMEKEPIIIERTFNAPMRNVWDALTNADALRKWFFNVSAFEPKIGFEFDFIGKGQEGQEFLHKCKITEVKEPHKLAYSWRYDGIEGISFVTIELQAEGENTKVKLIHAGLESFPATASFAKESFVQGWTALIGKLLPDYLKAVRIE